MKHTDRGHLAMGRPFLAFYTTIVFLTLFGTTYSQTSPVVISHPQTLTVPAGGDGIFTVSATGVSSYQWERNGVVIEGATASTYVVTNAQLAKTGRYSVRLSNGAGALTSAPAELRIAGNLFAVGHNGWGQLGDGSKSQRNTPVQIASNVASVSAALNHSLFVKGDNTLWATGNNGDGQLGDGTKIDRTVAVQVATGVSSVSAGYRHSLFVKTDRTLWATGYNEFGQLGDGTTTSRSSPIKISNEVAAAFAGSYHSFFIKTDGTLWAMGSNEYGKLGDGTAVNRSMPVLVATGVSTAAAGGSHSLFIKTDGSLWAMGLNRGGELGDGTSTNRAYPIRVATGVAHAAAGGSDLYGYSAFIKTDGTLWTMGLNDYGQLGDGTKVEKRVPTQVSTGAINVAAGNAHTAFLNSDGILRTAGKNDFGQLGTGNTASRSIPGGIAGNVLSTDVAFSSSFFIQQPASISIFTASSPVNADRTFDDSAQITIISNITNRTIYYTTDGTEPKIGSSPTYRNEPFSIKTSSIIRAIAVNLDDFSVVTAEPLSVTINQTYSLTVAVPGGGVAQKSPSSLRYRSGSIVNLDAVAASGWQFVRWTGDATGTVAQTSVVMDRDRSVQAVFGTSITTNSTGPGSISVIPASGPYPYGSVISVSPRPDANGAFSIWGGTASGTANPLEYKITSQNPTISALFTKIDPSQAVLTCTNVGSGSVSISPQKAVYARNETVVVNAIPGANFIFSGWSGALSGVENPASITLSESKSLTATFISVSEAMPVVIISPMSQSAARGGAVSFTVSVSSPLPIVYQWFKSGTPIADATGAKYTIPAVNAADAGSYSVRVSNSAGSATSSAAVLSVLESRLINLSILTPLESGESITLGAVLGGSGTSGSKALLIRGAGPSLAALGVTGFMTDPTLTVYRGQSTLATNDNWGGFATLSDAFTAVGAFSYASTTSRDSAYYGTALAPGAYTVQVRGVGTSSGTVIAELYDATAAANVTAATPRLVNVSVLKEIRAGDTLTAGFVIGGNAPKNVLVRAIGPTLGLAPFNIGGVMTDPRISVYSGQTVLASNDNWGTQSGGVSAAVLTAAFDSVGAFRIGDLASGDAALLLTLSPGNYTAVVSSANGGAGLLITEVYEVP
jgi:alpha-tubulin suppressor-like RCC1 family protein